MVQNNKNWAQTHTEKADRNGKEKVFQKLRSLHKKRGTNISNKNKQVKKLVKADKKS